MSQKKTIVSSVLVFLISSSTTVINNNIDLGCQGPLNLIFADQFKNAPYINI